MKTFKFDIQAAGTITVPDSLVTQLRNEARLGPEMGGDEYAHRMHNLHPDNDDEFIAALLKNTLRSTFRNGFGRDITDLMGCGLRMAPAQVQLAIPERVTERLAAKAEALPTQVIDKFDTGMELADSDDEPALTTAGEALP